MSTVVERDARPGRKARRATVTTAEPAGVGPLVEILSLRRVQLAGGLAAAVLIPALAMDPGAAHPLRALLAAAAALLLGYVAMRRMRAHPGVRAFGYVVYAFALAYAAAGVVLTATRAHGSAATLAISFTLATAWFLAVDRLTGKGAIWRLGYLDDAPAAALPRAPWVVWRRLDHPRADLSGMTGVAADLSAAHTPQWERFLARCALKGLPVYDLRHVSERLTGQVRVERLSENTLSAGLERVTYARFKRLLDVIAALAVSPVILAVLAAAAALVKLESPGPALFRQIRMGYRGRPFTIYKLRSMRADAAQGERFTEENDRRITRVGAFIRKYRIDELPQIWNILKGEMSWIGPRPEAVALSDWYEREVPFYCYRHMVRPGVTGWAQVNQGNVAQVDAAREKLHYDFYYIKNLSPWLDLLIAAKTVWTVLTGFGAR